MKRMIIALTALLMMAGTAQAMSYEQARDQALFLTDKMAYELNLTEDQYEAAYEINLDYLMSVNSVDDLYGLYWERRNLDLSYILLDWQYRAYLDARYFYRPLYWDAGYWHFGIYARYPHRTYFYFGRPHFYVTYHGGHSWHHNGGRSWYHGREFGHGHRNGTNNHGFGMRNGFDRGDYKGRGGHFERPKGGKELTPRHDKSIHRDGMEKGHNGVSGGNRKGGFGNRPSSTKQGSEAHPNGTSGKRNGSFSNPNRSFTPNKTDNNGSSRFGSSHSPALQRNSSVSHSPASQRSSSVSHSPVPQRSSSVSHSPAPQRSSSVSHSSGSRGGSSSHSSGSHGGGHFGGRK